MSLTDKKKARLVVYLVGLVSFCLLVWLLVTLRSVIQDPINHYQYQENRSLTEIPTSGEHSLIQAHTKQSDNALDQAVVVSNNSITTESKKCSSRCNSTLSMLNDDLHLDDETFQKLAAYTGEIAAYLEKDEQQRQHYMQMAMSTKDNDKRAYITGIFKQLPEQQKDEIAENFISSNSWRVRADGVTLMADDGVSNLHEANNLMDIFSREDNPYIKSRLLNYLEQSQTLRGDIGLLQQLDSALYYDENTSVQVAALKAKMQLSKEPYHILPDALQALRTDDPDFQLAALVAIEQVLAHGKNDTETNFYIDTHSIATEFDIIRNLPIYHNDKKRFESVINEANTIYLRHFESGI